MPKSFYQMYGHLIFSTKNRINWLDDNIRERVHAYMATMFRNMECSSVHVGGAKDHIHVLFNIGKENTPVKDEYCNFSWQKGYALYFVSPKYIGKVKEYIDNQILHHQKMSFKEEFLTYLHKYQIEYDEKYIWD